MRKLLFTLCCLTLIGCDSATAPDELGARLTKWVPGPDALLSERGFGGGYGHFVIRTDSAWESCWPKFGIQDATLPVINFETEMVLALDHVNTRALLDSIVEFEGGARVYATGEWIHPGAIASEVHALRLYAIPKFEIMEIRIE